MRILWKSTTGTGRNIFVDLVSAFLCIAALLPTGSALAQGAENGSFFADITVREDGNIVVTESIGDAPARTRSFSRAISFGHDEDALRWTVGKGVAVERFGAIVRLPDAMDSAAIRAECVPRGSCLANVQGTTAHFAADRPFTLAVRWPQGVVQVAATSYSSVAATFAAVFLAVILLFAFLRKRGLR